MNIVCTIPIKIIFYLRRVVIIYEADKPFGLKKKKN